MMGGFGTEILSWKGPGEGREIRQSTYLKRELEAVGGRMIFARAVHDFRPSFPSRCQYLYPLPHPKFFLLCLRPSSNKREPCLGKDRNLFLVKLTKAWRWVLGDPG